MRKAVALILGLEALVLVLAIVVFLAGENDGVEMPESVPTSDSLTKPLKTSVPVSINLSTVGTVKTTAHRPRGGAAMVVTTSSSSGQTSVTSVVVHASRHATRP
jgi:hypothetical protein